MVLCCRHLRGPAEDLILVFNDRSEIYIFDYFDGTGNNGACAAGPGTGLIESISFAKHAAGQPCPRSCQVVWCPVAQMSGEELPQESA